MHLLFSFCLSTFELPFSIHLIGLEEALFDFISLRTWSGPSWSPAQTLSSVLISIQSLLTEKPYHNEPGFERVRIRQYSLDVKS